MQDIVRRKLAELVGRFGLDLCNEARRCEALLRDVCGDHKREIVALVAAARDGVGSELRQSSAGVPKELIISRLAKRLHENFGLVEELARWAVESWAVALGVASPVAPSPGPLQFEAPDNAVGTVSVTESADAFTLGTAPNEIAVDLGNGVKLEMVLIPAGEFLMGSRDSRDKDEKPQHRVRITRPFYLGRFQVTQEQWEAVMGSNPSRFKGPRNPVEEISWDDCQQFFEKLNAKFSTGEETYRLPTEAEWEYACRAGSESQFCYGEAQGTLGDYAWYEVRGELAQEDASRWW